MTAAPSGAQILCPLPVLPTVFERARLPNEVTERRSTVALNRGFPKCLTGVERSIREI
jgi:hypothetical protein